MINVFLVFFLIFLSLIVYFIILVIKNFVSRWNLKRVLGVNFGNHLTKPVKSSNSMRYCYTKFESGSFAMPDIHFFMMCINGYHSSYEFIVVRERLFDKIFKMLSISKELQTGHRWFDKRYYIISESNEKLQRLLTLEPACQCIEKLLSEGFDYVKYEDGELQAGFNTFTGWRWFKPGVIKRSAEQLNRLCDLMEKLHDTTKKRQKNEPLYTCQIKGFAQFYIMLPDTALKHLPTKWVRQRKWWLKSAVYVAASGLAIYFITIFFTLYPSVRPEDLFNKSWIYIALPITILHLFAAGTHLAGRSRSHKELSFIAVFSGIGYSIIAVFMFQILNGFLDSSPAISHPSILIEAQHSSSRKGPDSYYIIVQSCHNPANTTQLTVTQSSYNFLQNHINKPISIQTKAGAFGVEWLYNYRLTLHKCLVP